MTHEHRDHFIPPSPRKKIKMTHGHAHGHSHGHAHGHSHGHAHGHSHGHVHGPTHEEDHHWLKAALGLVWGIGLLILSIASFNLPVFVYAILTALTALMTLYLGHRVYQSAWHDLSENKWDTSSLYSISTLTIVLVSIASLFIPGLPMMFEAAPLVLGFWHLGEAIEHSLINEINHKLDIRDCLPPYVVLKGNPDKPTSIKKLKPNDLILLQQGEVIPVDGIVTEATLLYTTRIDGSPLLKEFKPGDSVKAGMRFADHLAAVPICVSKTYKNSYLSLVAKNINKVHQEKAPLELLANKILHYFIPGLIGVAVLSGITIGLLFSPALAIQCVVSVLVSACPCVLSLITPLAVKIGMKKAAEHGIHFNNGKVLQATADIDTVVFDLNGTLTKGQVEVERLYMPDTNYLSHFALLESKSKHPVAKVISTFFANHHVIPSASLALSSVDQSNHSGIKGVIDGHLFLIGNKDMLVAHGITQFDKLYDKAPPGSIYLVRDSAIMGNIVLTDPLRDDAVAAIKQLQRMGKDIHICTGADQKSAHHYGKILGISKNNICASTVGTITKPYEKSKTSYIEQLKRQGCKVAMVGDAVNDLTAIAYANLGIAIKSSIGDNITEQHAGIVLQEGLLFPIATAFDVAKKTKNNIFQNLVISLTYNSLITLVAAGLFVALGLTLSPALGVALMVIESTIVLTNLYRLKQQDIISAASINPNSSSNEQLSSFKMINRLSKAEPKKDLPLVTEKQYSNSTTKGLFEVTKQEVYAPPLNQEEPISCFCWN